MISKIRLYNFGPFSDAEFDLMRRKDEPQTMAMVYGENGAGKTRLIGSVRFLKETARTYVGPQRAGIITSELTEFGITGGDADRKELNAVLEDLLGVLSRKAPLSPREANLRKVVRRYMMPGSDGMSVSYEFLIDGMRAVYVMSFDAEGFLVGESMDAQIGSRIMNVYTISSSDGGPDIRFSPSFFRDSEFRDEMTATIERYWGNDSFLSIMNDQYIIKNESFMNRAVLDSFDKVRRYIDSITVIFPSRDTDSQGGYDLCQGSVPSSESGLLDAAESAYDAFFRSIDGGIRGVRYDRKETDGGIRYSLVFDRRISDRVVSIPYSQESNGIRKLARMLPAMAKTAGGGTVLIDEMDSNIHDMMIAELVERIRGSIDGQLIFTSHNTEILDDSDPSTVYVIQVDRSGFRKIVPLKKAAKIQKTNSVRRQYLRGCFEGVPYIGDVDLRDVLKRFSETGMR